LSKLLILEKNSGELCLFRHEMPIIRVFYFIQN